jgi:hypothetical protein
MGKGMKAGRKPMFDERTTVVAVRIPVSFADKLPANKSEWIRNCIMARLIEDKINNMRKGERK